MTHPQPSHFLQQSQQHPPLPPPPPPPPPPQQLSPIVLPHPLKVNLLVRLRLLLRETEAKREQATGLIHRLRQVVFEQRKVENTIKKFIDTVMRDLSTPSV